PGRGYDHGAPPGRHDRRPDRPVRHAPGRLRLPEFALRGRLHRLDQPAHRHHRGRRTRPRRHRVRRADPPAVRQPRRQRAARHGSARVDPARAPGGVAHSARRRVQLGPRHGQPHGLDGQLRALPGAARFRQDRRGQRAQPAAGPDRRAGHRRGNLRQLGRRQRDGAGLMKPSSLRDWMPSGRTLAVAPPFLWLALFLLVPFLLVLKISFAELQFGIPPYTALAEFKDEAVQLSLHLRGYILLFTDSLYLATYLNSLKMAAVTTVCCVLIGYPIAYYIARSSPSIRNVLLLGVILPFWTSLLLRVYAWVGILRNDGLLNKLLMGLGIISSPLEIYRTDLAVYIGLVYAYLPFFILPLYANLVKMDLRLLEAAYDLGARPWQAFWRITVPLSRPGVIAGAMLVFIPSVGEYVIPEMLGGADTLMMGRVMWNEFFNNADWPMASAVTCVMVLLLLVPLALFQYNQVRQQEALQRGRA